MPEAKHTGWLVAGLLAGLVACCPGEASALPLGWSCIGNCGASGADGDVTAPPGGGTYDWISTVGGNGLGSQDLNRGELVPPEDAELVGSEDSGSIMRSFAFSANAGDTLDVDFNYVTSDSEFSPDFFPGHADYGWARLLDSALNPIALLFTVRTNVNGLDTVPGALMSPHAATISGASPILTGTGDFGGPLWSPLGVSSGECSNFSGLGCGYTDWLSASYQIATSGSYRLEFGVVNWFDQLYDSGLAIAGLSLNGDALAEDAPNVPEPGSLALLGSGLVLAARRLRARRRQA